MRMWKRLRKWRRSSVPGPADQRHSDARHLQRLGTTLGISVALGGIALVARVDYSIRTLAILTLILLVGLGGAVAYLRRVSD